MKRFFYSLLIAVPFFALFSCGEFELDGKWDPIQLDKEHVNFPAKGGQNIVSMLNYSYR